MKILGGILKGRNFFMAQGLRPTPNIIREAIFNIFGQDLTGVEFLELFAGSGAVGLEAFSRKAQRVILIEKDIKCAQVIEENIRLLATICCEDASSRIELIRGDVFVFIKQLANRHKKFDMIFLDPPYGRDLVKKTLKILETHDILHHNSFLVVQHNKREPLPDQIGRVLLIRQRKYGTSFLSIYQKK